MKFLVTDVETTGLDPVRDKLLEVACIMLDEEWNELDTFERVISQPEWSRTALIHRTDDFVVDMHTNNGLWDDVYGDRSQSRSSVDGQLAGWILGYTEEFEEVRVVGNSLRLDLNFIEHHLPMTQDEISYRSIDVSAVETFLNVGLDLPKFPRDDVSNHRAMDDARACYTQMLFHREALRELMRHA